MPGPRSAWAPLPPVGAAAGLSSCQVGRSPSASMHQPEVLPDTTASIRSAAHISAASTKKKARIATT
ncbi:hypothetical protein ACFFX0_16410 [Citricoccus parietis]|uniref:Uncharacterized protein n=1 Tax=Citricoccus parietis TaxID=592307 RepID=A0ABV5G187_9MICC